MKPLVLLTTLAALATGGAGASWAYQASAAVPPQRNSLHAAAPIPTTTLTSMAPCKAPAKLERGECVTHRVQTRVIVIPAPRVAPVVIAPSRTVAAPRVVTRVVVTRVVRRPIPTRTPVVEHEREHEDEHETEKPEAPKNDD